MLEAGSSGAWQTELLMLLWSACTGPGQDSIAPEPACIVSGRRCRTTAQPGLQSTQWAKMVDRHDAKILVIR